MTATKLDPALDTGDPIQDFHSPPGKPHIRHYPDMVQGTDEWRAARCGLLTASEMKHIITPAKLLPVKGVTEGTADHIYELASQRISGYVEPAYISDDMLRGQKDEYEAKKIYAEQYLPDMSDLRSVGFITNDIWGFTLGYSPDGLVQGDGLVECKSRRQKFQVELILGGAIPADHMIQMQTGLLVSERAWCDYVSYCGGLPMLTLRVYPDEKIQTAIIAAAALFHEKLREKLAAWSDSFNSGARLVPTERKKEEMFL